LTTSWIITIPKTVRWENYQQELNAAQDGRTLLNYRTRYFPKEMRVGDRCYVVWNGQVRGWMEIVGLVDAPTEWQCTTTGARWPAGKYIQRSGPFHGVDGPAMTGFRGVRGFDP
jgi:hypothetical protein